MKTKHVNLATKHAEYFNIKNFAQGKNKAILAKNVIVIRTSLHSDRNELHILQSENKHMTVKYHMDPSVRMFKYG